MQSQVSSSTQGAAALSSVSDFRATREAAPLIFTVKRFAERNEAFTEAALRNLIFKAEERHASNGMIPGNGLIECGAVIRLGRKVLIDEQKFFGWVKAQNEVK